LIKKDMAVAYLNMASFALNTAGSRLRMMSSGHDSFEDLFSRVSPLISTAVSDKIDAGGDEFNKHVVGGADLEIRRA
jgi:hypothetical protein